MDIIQVINFHTNAAKISFIINKVVDETSSSKDN